MLSSLNPSQVDNVVITWWKSNKTVNEPVMKIIHDNGDIWIDANGWFHGTLRSNR